jgi:hypothetical protein
MRELNKKGGRIEADCQIVCAFQTSQYPPTKYKLHILLGK